MAGDVQYSCTYNENTKAHVHTDWFWVLSIKIHFFKINFKNN
jgi:hypothetical protein